MIRFLFPHPFSLKKLASTSTIGDWSSETNRKLGAHKSQDGSEPRSNLERNQVQIRHVGYKRQGAVYWFQIVRKPNGPDLNCPFHTQLREGQRKDLTLEPRFPFGMPRRKSRREVRSARFVRFQRLCGMQGAYLAGDVQPHGEPIRVLSAMFRQLIDASFSYVLPANPGVGHEVPP